MENFVWLAPLKCAVLVMFFSAFTTVLLAALTSPDDERLRSMPLEDYNDR